MKVTCVCCVICRFRHRRGDGQTSAETVSGQRETHWDPWAWGLCWGWQEAQCEWGRQVVRGFVFSLCCTKNNYNTPFCQDRESLYIFLTAAILVNRFYSVLVCCHSHLTVVSLFSWNWLVSPRTRLPHNNVGQYLVVCKSISGLLPLSEPGWCICRGYMEKILCE